MALLYTWLNKPTTNHLSSGWLFIKYVILLLLAINVMICFLLIPITLSTIANRSANPETDHEEFGGASSFAASVYAVSFLLFSVATHVLGFISVKRQVYSLMISYCLASSLILLSIGLSMKTRDQSLVTWLIISLVTIALTFTFSLVVRRMQHPVGPTIVNQSDLDDILYSR